MMSLPDHDAKYEAPSSVTGSRLRVTDAPDVHIGAAGPVGRAGREREPRAVRREGGRLTDDLDPAGDRQLGRGRRLGALGRHDRRLADGSVVGSTDGSALASGDGSAEDVDDAEAAGLALASVGVGLDGSADAVADGVGAVVASGSATTMIESPVSSEFAIATTCCRVGELMIVRGVPFIARAASCVSRRAGQPAAPLTGQTDLTPAVV